MPLQLIGAGFGRTGTMSVTTALRELGLPCYHMTEVLDNPDNRGHLDIWIDVANSAPGTPRNWETLFARYAAAIDNPACCVWRELHQAYPDAKVLLTLHPHGADAWYASTLDTIYFTESMWQFKILKWFTPFGHKLGHLCRRLIWQRSHRGTMANRAQAIARYHEHIAEVTAAIPADQLLVYSVDQGWAPLCAFLGAPVPGTPFPKVNDRAQFKQTISKMTRGAYVILAGLVALAAALAYAAFKLLR